MKATTLDLAALGARMKAAREHFKLSRPAFAAKFGGTSVRTLENNEKGMNEPGVGLLADFAELGVNAHWVVTGIGEMLLPAGMTTELQAQEGAPLGYREQPAKINTKALAAIIEGVAKAQPSASPARLAMLAAEFYVKALDEGYITPEGVGDGPLSDSA